MGIDTIAVTLDSLVCPVCGRREVYMCDHSKGSEDKQIIHVYCDSCGYGGQGNWSIGADAGMRLE